MSFGNGAMLVPPEIEDARQRLGAAKSAEVEAIAEGVAEAAREVFDRLRERIEALETRLAVVETRGLEYVGVWQRACDYRRGQSTTFDGNLWTALRTVTAGEQPGKSDGWQLSCRAGRDAKDAR